MGAVKLTDILGIDWETFSEVDLTDCGASVYSRHESTEVLMGAWSLNDGPIEQWDYGNGEPMPKRLAEMLSDPDVQKWAWNAAFETQILRNTLHEPVDIRQWRCTMVQAMHCSLPGSLDKAGPIVGLPPEMQKDKRGKALIRKFSIPNKPTKAHPTPRWLPQEAPEEYQEFLDYNRADVGAEGGIRRRLMPYLMSQDEWDMWHLDQTINERGLPINQRMVMNAIRIYESSLEESFERMRELTGLRNPNSGSQLLPWLQDRGYIFDDLKKGHVQQAVGYFNDKPEHWSEDAWDGYSSDHELKEVLQLRLETSRTSIKKFYALARATDDDGVIRHILQMNGAPRTNRWAGRIYQPQNLPRPEKRFEDFQETLARSVEVLDAPSINLIYGNVFDVLASTLRPSAQAPDGKVFVDVDLSAIENRVLGWIAGCDRILKVFRDKMDPYLAFAVYLFDEAYEDLWHEYKVEKKGLKRTIAKPGTLGCGYGMGAGKKRINPETGEIEADGLLGYAWGMGVRQFTEEDAKHSVDTFRKTYSEVVDYWYALERAAKKCVRTGKPIRRGHILFDMKGPFLRMILPSGRPLHYLRPMLEEKKTPWGEMRTTLTYEGLNDKKMWVRQHTTPGKLTENADQAVSRDLLVHGIKRANERGIDVRLHVHDQIVGLVAEEGAEEKLDLLKECMEEQPKWADGLPLGSAGAITRVFVKD